MKRISFLPILAILLLCRPATGQNNAPAYKLYDDTEVAEIRITMDPEAYNWMMSHPQSDSLHLCKVYFKNALIDETVENVGITIRGNTSREAQKKSFKLSFNNFEPGGKFHGVDKMNLNGEHNDPSISRAKICWDLFQDIGLKASRAAHAAVYINDVYHGLYISIEHLDDEFLRKNFADDTGNLWKCLYGADLQYKGTNPDSYKFGPYTLVTNEDKGDYSQLARLVRIITQTRNDAFQDSLEKILYIDTFLKYQAMNVLVGGWDDYWSLSNNYYLYFEPAAKKFHWIPYDYDNTFGIDFFNINWAEADPYKFPKVSSGYRPLIERILSVPEYRNLYSRFLEFYRANVVNNGYLYFKINNLRTKLTTYAYYDTYRVKDYGFDMNDFTNSFSSINKYPARMGIIQFIQSRYNYLANKINYQAAKPVIYKINFSPVTPGPKDSIRVYASAFDNDGVEKLTIKFEPTSSGIAQEYEMTFSPLNTRKVEDADRWIGTIPPLGSGGSGKFKITVTDKNGATNRYPKAEYVELKATQTPAADKLVINEFMADNKSTVQDPAGEFDDWIEIYNPTSQNILLTGLYFTDKKDNPTKWQITEQNLNIKPGEYLLVWCDENHNDNQPGIHTNFKLSAGGEFIGIVAPDGITWIDSLTFGPQQADISFGRSPDGSLNWGFMTATPGASNSLTDVEEISLPTGFSVSIYPNPFNPTTNIQYNLPTVSDVTITIYDLLGREVWNKEIRNQPAGTHRLEWNAVDNYGKKVSSGIYLCRVNSNKFSIVKKMVLIR